MATTTRRKKAKKELVEFAWEGQRYILDLTKNTVYQNWMALDTNRGCEILGAYRQEATV